MLKLYIYQLVPFQRIPEFVEGLILLDFQIFKHLWCIAANYDKNVTLTV